MFRSPGAFAQAESPVIAFSDLVNILLEHHPVARQADLRLDLAEARMREARGRFDPVLGSSWNQKEFDGKQYYKQFYNAITIPTFLGVEVSGGYENTEGLYLNPERVTDTYGLWHVGVEVNLLQGLLIDERRTALNQAKTYAGLAENQRVAMLNDLLFEAGSAYIDWQKAYFTQAVIEEGIALAANYLENVKSGYLNGENTAMDTLEAYLGLQDRTFLAMDNRAELITARQKLENYLWIDGVPVQLAPTSRPGELLDFEFVMPDTSSTDSLLSNHPLIAQQQARLNLLRADQRLKQDP